MNHHLEHHSLEFLLLITTMRWSASSRALTKKMHNSVNTESTLCLQPNNAIRVDVTGVSWPFIHWPHHTTRAWWQDLNIFLFRARSQASPIRQILFWSHSSRAVRSVLWLYLYTTSVMISHHLYSLFPPKIKNILCAASCINRKFWYFESLIRWWYDNDTQSSWRS